MLNESLTTVDYYPVIIINHPITDYATVKECLRVSRVASQEVGQKYAITTFDLGVCMKAYPILWKSPDFYSDQICHDRVLSPVLRLFENDWKENEGIWIHGYSH